ncbi:hypothetical protein [Reyranella sp.]|jgi:hypothetical protein|uniref:hypothetical protein n=1 Tax=Reyranella sp. TaxID=1929291 RepID=UPI002F957FE4
MDPWTLRVAELNIQYYEGLLAQELDPAKAATIHRLLAAEKATLSRLREERLSTEFTQPLPRAASASD